MRAFTDVGALFARSSGCRLDIGLFFGELSAKVFRETPERVSLPADLALGVKTAAHRPSFPRNAVTSGKPYVSVTHRICYTAHVAQNIIGGA